ncbi:MAG: hypothetical protein MUD08_12185 [Cytophagales bacterium]|nr:hypothetical protein [Cytophagales bacterium]
MKNIFLLPLFCLLALTAHGQSDKPSQQVVHLKNGSVIRQATSLKHLDSLIEVKTTDGSVFRFEASQLDKFSRETVRPSLRQSGFFVGFDMGLGMGRSYLDVPGNDARESSFFLQMTAGHQWNPKLNTGGGFGIDHYGVGTFLPVFGRVSYAPLRTRLSPVATLDAGYGFYTRALNGDPAPNQTVDGGFFINPAAGFLVRTGWRTNLSFTVGYRHQAHRQRIAQEWGRDGDVVTIQEMVMRRTSIRMSWTF